MAHRIANWDVALARWANATRGQAFVWGQTDCVSLARQAMALMYAQPVGPPIEPYADADTAQQVLHRLGSIRTVLVGLGAVVVPPHFEHSGDFVLLPAGDGEFTDGISVVIGTGKVVTTTEAHGVVVLPLYIVRQAAPALEVLRLPEQL